MQDQHRNIVVVDDDAEMNQAIERLLAASGFETTTFPSAEALLEAGAAAKATCLILDIHLPRLSGFDLLRRLRQSGIVTPAIFITAYDDEESQALANEMGAVAYLIKPFQGQHLLTAINEVVASR